MEFIRNILVIDKSEDQSAEIKNLLTKKNNKFKVFTLSGRGKLAEVMAKNEIRYLILNANIGKQDVMFTLRFVSMLNEKTGQELPVFFISEDYELLQAVLADFPLKKLQVMHTPLDIEDLVEKAYLTAFPNAAFSNKAKSKSGSMNVDLEFMNIFISNTKRIISEMAQLPELKHSPPVLMANISGPLNIAISSKIMISSEYFKGSYYIAFPKETFFNFYEKVVMEKCSEINNENKDFVGELANIIYGQCKKRFSDEGISLDMVIPSIHMGDINYSVVILIPFESPLGKFYLAVAPGLI
jgi:CheY-specific phosphatase CheX